MRIWRTAFEQAFWEDTTTRDVLLTIDRSFWAVCLVNIAIDGLGFPRLVPASTWVWFAAVLCSYMAGAVAVAVAIKRDQNGYYKHRGLIMFLNRAVRIAIGSIVLLTLDHESLVKLYVTDKLASGRHAFLVVVLILTHLTYNHLPWALYFPLPFSQGIWLDLIQMVLRLLLTVRRCQHLLAQSGIRPTVTSICTTTNMVLSGMHPMGVTLLVPFNLVCQEEGPLLLSLFAWWFFGTFLPTFTAWYCESVMKEKFAGRHENVSGMVGEGPESVGTKSWGEYFLVCFTVAYVSWMVLHLLLVPPRNRDLVARIVQLICK